MNFILLLEGDTLPDQVQVPHNLGLSLVISSKVMKTRRASHYFSFLPSLQS